MKILIEGPEEPPFVSTEEEFGANSPVPEFFKRMHCNKIVMHTGEGVWNYTLLGEDSGDDQAVG